MMSLYFLQCKITLGFTVANTGNVQGLRANQIAALSTDGVLFPKSIQNMSEISEVSELCPKFEHCFYRNIANF